MPQVLGARETVRERQPRPGVARERNLRVRDREVERLSKTPAEPSTKEKLSSAATDAYSGLVSAVLDLPEYAGRAAQGYSKLPLTMPRPGGELRLPSGLAPETRMPGAALAEQSGAFLRALASEAKRDLPVPDPRVQESFLFGTLPRGFGQVGGTVLAGAAGGGAGAFAQATATASNALMEQVETELAPKVKAGELTQDEADERAFTAFGAGLGLGLLDMLPVLGLLRRADKATGGGVKRAIKDVAKGAASEAATEIVQTAGEQETVAWLTDDERTILERLSQGGAGQIGEAGGAGGIIGGVLTMALLGAKGAARRARRGRAGREAAPTPTEPSEASVQPEAAQAVVEVPRGTVEGAAEAGRAVQVVVPEGSMVGPAGTFEGRVLETDGEMALVAPPEGQEGEARWVPREWVQEDVAPVAPAQAGVDPAAVEIAPPVGDDADLVAAQRLEEAGDRSLREALGIPEGQELQPEFRAPPGLYEEIVRGPAPPVAPPAVQAAPASPSEAVLQAIPPPPEPPRTAEASAQEAERVTSIKNRIVDAELVSMGLEPTTPGERLAFEEANQRAAEMLAADPLAGQRLAKELARDMRATTGEETALLTRERNRLRLLRRDIEQEIIKAADAGDADLVQELQTRAGKIIDEFAFMSGISRRAGTTTAQGLALRRMEMKEDYSLAGIETSWRAAQGGAPLTAEQQAEIRTLHRKLEEAEARFEAQAAASDERVKLLEEQIDTLIKAKARERRRERKPDGPVLAYIGSKANAARERIKARGAQLSAGFDPQQWADHILVGVDYIARDIADLTAWSKAMLQEFGESIRPHLQTIYDAATKSLGAVQAEAKRDVAAGKLSAAQSEGKDVREAATQVRQLAESFIEGGVTEREALIDAVHGVLVGLDPTITRRDTMDLISGYGEFKPLSQDEVKVRLRQLRGEMQQIAKLDDMLRKGELPLKTGVERRAPTDEERRLIRQVNETRKQLNLTGDRETHLQSALDSTKTRLRHQIADLQHQIDAGTRTIKDRVKPLKDAEVEELIRQRDKLQEQFKAIFEPPVQLPGHTEVMRAQAAERAVEKAIKDYQRRIAAGELAAQQRRPMFTTERLEALRARRDALSDELANLRAAQKPRLSPEERALRSYKSRLKNELARLREKIAAGDFTPKAKRDPLRLDEETTKVRAEVEKARAEIDRGIERERLRNRTTLQKVGAIAKDVSFDVLRALRTAYDMSAVLRQGGFFSLAEPVKSAKALAASLRALASEDYAQRVNVALENRPLASLGRQAGLDLTELGGRPGGREEELMSTLADRIPGVRPSNRAFTTFLNVQRALAFDDMVQGAPDAVTQDQARALATLVNVATGRGAPGRFAPAMQYLAIPFWSPRLTLSRFQLLLGQPLWRGDRMTRKLVVKQYAKALVGIGAVYSLVQMFDALDGEDDVSIEFDPRSSDFGKIRVGRTRIDPLAGLSQMTVLLARLTPPFKKKTKTGEIVSLRGDVGYGKDDVLDVISHFLRSKASPTFGLAAELISGKDYNDREIGVGESLAGAAIPLATTDLAEAIQEHGLSRGSAFGLLSLLGWAVNVHREEEEAGPGSAVLEWLQGIGSP